MSAEVVIEQFVDTNIFVYAYDLTAGIKRSQAKKCIKALWEDQTGCLSVQVLQELFVNITRKISNPLDSSTAKQIIADLSQWRVHIPDAEDLLLAIDLSDKYQLSFWDAMIVESAISLGCKRLISEDFSHGMKFGEIQVINPFENGN